MSLNPAVEKRFGNALIIISTILMAIALGVYSKGTLSHKEILLTPVLLACSLSGVLGVMVRVRATREKEYDTNGKED